MAQPATSQAKLMGANFCYLVEFVNRRYGAMRRRCWSAALIGGGGPLC